MKKQNGAGAVGIVVTLVHRTAIWFGVTGQESLRVRKRKCECWSPGLMSGKMKHAAPSRGLGMAMAWIRQDVVLPADRNMKIVGRGEKRDYE